ncbi:MAG: hypothetical protein NZ959_09640 [Armatimonadetes bacterium]|nr:hypothetical protein [Armatimonadota bacterium]MDW8122736.1 SpoIVB peptidase S55 domain-containing protein [Armatimonadota bacterium]
MRRLLIGAVSSLIVLMTSLAISLDRKDILAPTELRPGMKGYGLSVFKGTEIEKFPITVLGVLERVDFDMDMIVIRVDGGTVVRRRSGVVAGMSGSPIFVNGKLIGAIAWALEMFPREPFCGVTPITAMLSSTQPDQFPSPRLRAGRLKPRGGPLYIKNKPFYRFRVAPTLRQVADLKGQLAPGEGLLRPIATPLIVSGVPRSVRRLLAKLLEPYNLMVLDSFGSPATVPVKDAPLKPGSAIGVRLFGGDVDATGIGTVTWVEKNKIWAFGHGMMELGKADLPITSAYILDILPTLMISSKIGVALKEKGRLTQDRIFAIAGELGTPSPKVPMRVSLTDASRQLSRRYRLELVTHKELVTLGAYTGLAGALLVNISPYEEGSTFMELEVEAEGFPTIVRRNWYPNEGGGLLTISLMIGGAARTSPLSELADVLEAIRGNRFGEVKLKRIEATLQYAPKKLSAWIDSVTARKTKVKAGDKVPVTFKVKGWEGLEKTLTVDLEVPSRARPGRLRYLVGGGMVGEAVRQQSGYRRPRPRSLQDLFAQLQDVYANNEVVAATSPMTSGVEVAGQRWEGLPAPIVEVLMGMGSSDITPIRDYWEKRLPFDYLLSGIASITLTVEADEREKEAPARPPLAEGPRPPMGPAEGEGPGGPPPPPDGETEFARIAALAQRLTPPLALLKDPVERAFWEIQWRRLYWTAFFEAPYTLTAGGSSFLSSTVGQEAAQEPGQEESLQPPGWEEVESLEPGQPEKKEEAPQVTPQEPTRPTPPAKGRPIARAPRTWSLVKGDDFLKGKLDGTTVSTDGTISLGFRSRVVYDPQESIGAFCLFPTEEGLYVGTLAPARLLFIGKDGSRTVLAEIADERVITSVAVAPDNAIWFACAPNGSVYRLASHESQPVKVTQVAGSVWRIVPWQGDQILLATGPSGTLYRLPFPPPTESPVKPEVLLQLSERHLIAVAVAPDGTVYLGTNPRGKVYALLPDGTSQPIFECPQNPVQSLATDRKGRLYIGTSGAGIVYLREPDGRWRELRRFNPERHIMAMVGQEDGVLIATGSPGKVYRLTADGILTWLYDSDESHLLSIASDGRRMWTIPSGTGEVRELVLNQEGTYTSPVLDAQQVSRWGILRFSATVPEGALVVVQTRSGNTAYPDKTWSPWSQGSVASGLPVASPPARYLQLRFLFKSNESGHSAKVSRVELTYLPKNQPPKITIQEPAPGRFVSGSVTIRWRGEDPDKDSLTYEPYFSSDGQQWTPIPAKPAPDEKRDIKDKKEEKKGEEKEQGGPSPQGTSTTTQTSVSWDTTKVSDGRYWIRVIATDRVPNPDDPLSAQDTLFPVIVDNSAPGIFLDQVQIRDGKLLVPCSDGWLIGSGEYRVGDGEWLAAYCDDGVFDSPYEVLVLDLSLLPKGAKEIQVRVRDGAGNERVERIKRPGS